MEIKQLRETLEPGMVIAFKGMSGIHEMVFQRWAGAFMTGIPTDDTVRIEGMQPSEKMYASKRDLIAINRIQAEKFHLVRPDIQRFLYR